MPEQSLATMVDAYEMRALAEGLAARFAAERGLSDGLRMRMETALADGDKALAAETDDGDRRVLYAEANAAFHDVIHEAAQSQLVCDVLRICQRVPQTLARKIVAFDLADVRQRHAAHRQICEAIICREPREAERLMCQHVLAVKLSMARWFGRQRAADPNQGAFGSVEAADQSACRDDACAAFSERIFFGMT